MLSKFKDDEGGFTLIELLVVILIIGILAAVALPTFLNQGKKGADAAAKSDVRSTATKVEACAAEGNTYTACLSTGAANIKVPLPTGVTASAISDTAGSEGYTLTATTNGKGSETSWKVTSANGNVGAPVAG